MNINQIKESIKIISKEGKGDVLMITAQPGVGKSEAVYQAAQEEAEERGMDFYEGPENFDENKFGLIDLRLATVDTIDLGGLPLIDPNSTVTKFTRSPFIPANGQGILFLDELPQAKPANQAAVSQLILDKRVGCHKLGEGWKIVAAGNDVQHMASAHKIPTHIANRLNFQDLDFDIKAFVKHLEQKEVNESAIAFSKFKPSIFDGFDTNNKVNCTPRSYMAAANYLNIEDEDMMFSLIAGRVSEGVATELFAFRKIWVNLPEFEEFVNKPTSIKIPSEADIMFATIQMLASRTCDKTIKQINKYLERITKEDKLEVVISFWKTLLNRCPIAVRSKIMITTEFREFIKHNKEYMA